MNRGYLNDRQKEELFYRQFKCCANRPDSRDPSFYYINQSSERIKYMCPLFFKESTFDESGYQADHIVELAAGGSNDISNFQLLCPCCHSFKTKLYTRQPLVQGGRQFTSAERAVGAAGMEELEKTPKKRRLPPTEGMDIDDDINYLRG
jgi:hypothetical protein